MAVQMERRLFNADELPKLIESGILHEDERIELIDGDLVKMSPIGEKHAKILRRLLRILPKLLEDKYLLDAQNPVRLSDFNQPQPDITVLRWREDDYADGHPTADAVLLIIEISDTSLAFDQEIKLPRYAAAGVPEVWIIDINRNKVEQYTNPQHDYYQMHLTLSVGDTLSPHFDNTIAISIQNLFR